MKRGQLIYMLNFLPFQELTASLYYLCALRPPRLQSRTASQVASARVNRSPTYEHGFAKE